MEWAYALNLFAEETNSSFHSGFTPNLKSYIAYINIKRIKFVYFCGASLVIN